MLAAAPTAILEQTVHFEEFYRSQADRVYRALSMTLADHSLAREATDEAMARAFMHWNRVGRYHNPGGWVYRVGLNWATSFWRRFGRELPIAAAPDSGQVPEDHAYAAGLVAGLPKAQRAVVVCRVFLQLSTSETAVALNIAEGTVKSRLARALAVLRTTVEEETSHG